MSGRLAILARSNRGLGFPSGSLFRTGGKADYQDQTDAPHQGLLKTVGGRRWRGNQAKAVTENSDAELRCPKPSDDSTAAAWRRGYGRVGFATRTRPR